MITANEIIKDLEIVVKTFRACEYERAAGILEIMILHYKKELKEANNGRQ